MSDDPTRRAEESGAQEGDEASAPLPELPLPMVVARIIIVTGMSFTAAAAIFLLVGGLWLYALAGLGATAVFLVLMFAVERLAE